MSRALAARGHNEILIDTGQHVLPSMADEIAAESGLRRPDVQLRVRGSARGRADRAPRRRHRSHPRASELRMGRRLRRHELDAGRAPGRRPGAGFGSRTSKRDCAASIRRWPKSRIGVETDRLATLRLCPSELARDHLVREGITAGVHLVGDVMLDALLHTLAQSPSAGDLLACLNPPGTDYIVATLHRAGTVDRSGTADARPAGARASAVSRPVSSPSPHGVRAWRELGFPPSPGVHRLPPLGRAAMVALLRDARAVVTDSGGLQKEAYWLGVPCLTVRDETEWPETVSAGWNRLVGADAGGLAAALAAIDAPGGPPACLWRAWCRLPLCRAARIGNVIEFPASRAPGTPRVTCYTQAFVAERRA